MNNIDSRPLSTIFYKVAACRRQDVAIVCGARHPLRLAKQACVLPTAALAAPSLIPPPAALRLATVDFESTTSTNSITPADLLHCMIQEGLILLRYPMIASAQTPSLLIDRCHSLNSFLLPQAALVSLPITPAEVNARIIQ